MTARSRREREPGFIVTEEQRAILETAARFVEEEVTPYAARLDADPDPLPPASHGRSSMGSVSEPSDPRRLARSKGIGERDARARDYLTTPIALRNSVCSASRATRYLENCALPM